MRPLQPTANIIAWGLELKSGRQFIWKTPPPPTQLPRTLSLLEMCVRQVRALLHTVLLYLQRMKHNKVKHITVSLQEWVLPTACIIVSYMLRGVCVCARSFFVCWVKLCD